MTSTEIRKTFLEFFASKGHQIVPSAPMVIKNDPTLMFTNAGMNQFKDIFLGNSPVKYPRIANTQKCLRVSGKHNDLEEVGVDTYHHTMFEMLGNWSFGDYFKKEAIEWAWELLHKVYGIPKDRLYVTVFEGDKKENLDFDQEAYDFWKQWIAEDRILKGNKKDNFWEMGDTGPCGPCSEIHVDLRTDEDRKKVDGRTLVNESHPQVIEIWNNVFMQYNRLANGSLEPLPAQHVDTGMGFERLCMALQGKTSNYDTDVFQPMIQFISSKCGIAYGASEKTDIAMRVMADHIRAISFAVADGQLPSNNKAGYVIRRILRRAVRYAYSFLNFKEPVLSTMVPVLAKTFAGQFPELETQQDFIARVIHEEENAFLKTLETGIKKFDQYQEKKVDGKFAFELFDTFGFPIDLTQLMARERELEVDMDGFNKAMLEQKTRSRADAEKDLSDWIQVKEDEPVDFIGYESFESDCEILRYREVKTKGKTQYQLVLNRTPFYAESGGQVGDTGFLINEKESIRVFDTQKENNLIVHYCDKLPAEPSATFHAKIDGVRRKNITGNHSATHLMHSALRNVLGKHVAQKGSLVNDEITRFDFSHFTKVSDEEIEKIEKIVNEKIRENIALNEQRNVPIAKATELGAMALFGEKYGEYVRVITFDPTFSVELCGGTHVKATGEIGLFKVISESSVAAGVRRVEAITGVGAENFMRAQNHELNEIKSLLKNSKEPAKGIQSLLDEQENLRKQIEALLLEKASIVKSELKQRMTLSHGVHIIAEKIDLASADAVKNISFDLRNQIENLILLLGTEIDGKPHVSLIISDNLVEDKNLNASNLIRTIAKEIQGGGGGQPFYATAGGKDVNGLDKAILVGRDVIKSAIDK
ncbi:MAG TPA: alanine--tRNA ligase [Bacteroidia bacterium]|nr:alanine--tRNA ligase [Bacteroidia bacterium]